MMRRMEWSPQGTVRFLHGLRVTSENPRHVVRTALDVRAMPKEIEHADGAVRPRRTNLPRRRQRAPERIGGHPGVGKGVSQLRTVRGQRKSESAADARGGNA